VANSSKYSLALPEQFTLRGLIDVSPLLAKTMVSVAELEHAIPAKEATKQATTIARHKTIRATFLPLLVGVGVWAACKYPNASFAIALMLAILALPSLIEKWKKPE